MTQPNSLADRTPMGDYFPASMVGRDSVTSTSDLARELVGDPATVLPLVVWSWRQTAGRGRGDRSWWSDQGSLCFTIGLDPDQHGLRPEHEPRMALAAAVAVIDSFAQELPAETLGIRWPNDIEAHGRKLGGILPERVESPNGPRLLIGIGLNVRSNLENAPPEVAALATSIAALGGANEPMHVLLRRILDSIQAAIRALASDDPALVARWQALDTLRDQPVRIDLGPSILVGTARGIDATGALVVDSDGRRQPIHGGQVLRD